MHEAPAAANDRPRLKAIARAGVGVDNIDLDAATSYGIAVMNSASASTITTAEHAFALMIALARNVAAAHMTMSSGGWDRNKFTGAQLHGKTLGVVGFGRIGQTLARRALAFGMNVIAYDPLINPARRWKATCVCSARLMNCLRWRTSSVFMCRRLNRQ